MAHTDESEKLRIELAIVYCPVEMKRSLSNDVAGDFANEWNIELGPSSEHIEACIIRP